MEDQIIKKEFKLSIIGAIGINLFYETFLPLIIRIPLLNFFENQYFAAHQLYLAVLMLLLDIISYILAIKLLIGQIRRKFKYKFKLRLIENFNYKLIISTLFLVIGYFMWYQSSIAIEVQKIPIPIPKFIAEAFDETSVKPYYLYGTVILVAPIFEEIFFRGIFLEGFINKYKPLTAVIASALIFGAAHFNIPQFINASLLGIIFGFVYYKSRSLLLCICAHMLNNSMVFLLYYLGFSPSITSFLIGIIIFITAGRIFVKNLRRESKVKDQEDIGNTI